MRANSGWAGCWARFGDEQRGIIFKCRDNGSPMNVGIVTTWFERGAAYVSRQFKTTLEQQCNVQIYARGGEKGSDCGMDWEGPGVTRGKEPSLPFLTAIDEADFCRWLDDRQIEVILFNEQRWWLPVLWCRRRGLKVGAYIDYYTESTVELFDAYDVGRTGFVVNELRAHALLVEVAVLYVIADFLTCKE